MDVLSSLQDFLAAFAAALWMTTREVSPFLLLGLIFAGILHVFVPSKWILWALGPMRWIGAFRGAMIGVPLPLGSRSALATAIALRRQGASLSTSTAFMVSKPETSMDSLAITLALLPTIFVGVRPFAGVVLSILVGVFVENISSSKKEERVQNVSEFLNKDSASAKRVKKEEHWDFFKVCGLVDQSSSKRSFLLSARSVFRYAFQVFFNGIGLWLALGLIFAGLVQISIPDSMFKSMWWMSHSNLQVFLASIIGIPLYSCSAATTPVVAVLLAKGLNPGAALVLLLAGPATSASNIVALRQEFGVRYTVAYFSATLVFGLMLGLFFNLIWPLFQNFPSLVVVPDHGTNFIHMIPDWVEVLSATIIIALSLRAIGSEIFKPRKNLAVTQKRSHEHAKVKKKNHS